MVRAGQLRVDVVPGGPESVIADLRGGVEAKNGGTGGLKLVSHVRVEQLGARKRVEVRARVLVRIDDWFGSVQARRCNSIVLTNNIVEVAPSRDSVSRVLV